MITGLITHSAYGQPAQTAELCAALASGVGSVKILSAKRDGHGFGEAAGLSLGWAATFMADASVAGWSGGGQQSFWAWAGSAAIGFALSFMWDHHQRHDELERHHKRATITNTSANLRLIELREEMALLKLKSEYAKHTLEVEAEPVFARGLGGDLQEAVYQLTDRKVNLRTPTVKDTEHGWKATVDLTGYSFKKLQRDLDGIGQHLDLEGGLEARQGSSKGWAELEYRKPAVWPLSAPWSPPQAGLEWDAPLSLGVDGYGSHIELDLSVHAVVAGATGFGKSNLINSMVLQLAQRQKVQVIGIDMKPYAPEFTPLRPVLADLVTDLKGAHAALDWFIEEMYRRGEIMQRNGWKKWRPTEEDPIIYQFWDEYGEAIRQEKTSRGAKGKTAGDSLQNKVETILAMSRAYGLFMVLCTQQPSAKMFGEDTGPRGNLPIRICFTMSEAIHDRFVLPQAGGWTTALLDGQPGRFLMMSPKHREPEPYLAYEVSEGTLAQETARLGSTTQASESAPVLQLVKMTKTPPSFSEMAGAVEVQLALGPATRRELADRLGVDAGASQLKNALTKLANAGTAVKDDDHVWRLTGS